MADDIMYKGIYRGDPNKGFGVGGIDGVHHKGVKGWDNTKVGMAASIFNNILSQHGVKTWDPNNMGLLEPIRTGLFIVKLLKVPPFFDDVAVEYLKFFLENCCRSIDGIPDNSINPISGTPFGANGIEMDFPGGYKQQAKEFTITSMTNTGDGFGTIMRYWKYGMTDPETQVHHMYGKNLRFQRSNYSASLIYAFLGPTARPGDIEYANIWHEFWPTSPDGKAKFNSGTLGEVTAISEVQETFTGIFQDGPEVNILAKYIVASIGLGGISYADQMLPAYMYENFFTKLEAADKDLIKSMSITASDRLETASELYTAGIQSVRDGMREKYGVNDSSIEDTINAEESIKALNGFSQASFKEK